MKRRVPRSQAELIFFAQKIASGLKKDPELFSNTPVGYKQLNDIIDEVRQSISEVAEQKSQYLAALEKKQKRIKTLYKDAAEVANYLYRIGKNKKEILSKVGINNAEKKSPEKPGQCLNFNIVKQNINGSITLKWKRPKNGGAIKSYIIQRKEFNAASDAWETVWAQTGKQTELKKQPQNKILEYRVCALNSLGIGEPSNSVTAKF
ncbi:MAG: fibronectin type III domain-containing protein [Deltaproteobacteria bacterium]|nr:fibronectin type III domain-containing protein [Deltaproteobacteria bacterium]